MTTSKTYPLGSKLVFTGYTELADGMQPLLTEGAIVEVTGYGDNGAVQVKDTENSDLADTLFPDEFKVYEEPEAEAETEAEAEPEAETAEELPLEGVTFDPEATVRDLRMVATTRDLKPSGRSKADVIASLEAMGATAKAEIEEEAVEETAGDAPITTIAVAEKTDIVVIEDSDRVRELLEAQDALDAAKALAQQAEEAFFSLGGVLSHVHEKDLHKGILGEDGEPKYDGKQGFADYAFNELNVNYRKAMHLITIYRKFRELGLDETRAIQIGWTKLREMVGVMTDDNADELLTYGTEHTRDEIIDFVKVSYVNASDEKTPKAKKTLMKFNLFEANAEIVRSAIDSAMEQGGVSTPEQALALICAEWGQLTGNIEVPLPEAIEALELRHNVQIGVREGADRVTDGETVDA